jgi:hypothetical protein
MFLSATVEAMEAMVAERGTEMTEWNDGRLDDLSNRVDRVEKKVDAGFAQADEKMDAGFARLDKKMDDGFARVDMRLDALNGVMIRSMWTFGVGMLTFAGALLGIIADK